MRGRIRLNSVRSKLSSVQLPRKQSVLKINFYIKGSSYVKCATRVGSLINAVGVLIFVRLFTIAFK